jgi:predicted dehydrogenase
MNKQLKFLISGYGLIGKKHGELVHKNTNCILTAIADPLLLKTELPRDYINTALYNDFQTALDNQEIDAVIISSPNEFHYEQTIACINNNIPVLVEKPMTANIRQARNLLEIAENANAKLLVGHHRTYSPYLTAANTFLKSGLFGKLVAVHGSALFYKPDDYFKAGPWRTKLGGGPILINLIHEIGLLRYLCGEIESVFAFSENNTRHFEVEDTVSINFRFKNGALGTFILSDTAASNQSWEMNSGENKAYPYYAEQNSYFFSGTNGSLDFPSMNSRTYSDLNQKSWWRDFLNNKIRVEFADPLSMQLDHFIDVIRDSTPPKVSAFDGYKNMQVIEAISLSIEQNKPIEVDKIH